MPKPPTTISLRVNISPALFAKISDYRHAAKHESKGQAVRTLLSAGLVQLSQPATVPPQPRKPIPFAGAELRHGADA